MGISDEPALIPFLRVPETFPQYIKAALPEFRRWSLLGFILNSFLKLDLEEFVSKLLLTTATGSAAPGLSWILMAKSTWRGCLQAVLFLKLGPRTCLGSELQT